MVIDWGVLAGVHVFCAVLAWSRIRFVRFADNERADTTLSMLAECFEVLGGVPKIVLADRMGCLKAGVVSSSSSAPRIGANVGPGFGADVAEAQEPATTRKVMV